MKERVKKAGYGLFNIVSLFGFLLGLLLIIFVKRGEGIESERKGSEGHEPKGVPKNITHSIPEQIGLNDRQSIILKEISKRGSMTPRDIYGLFPEVSTRTMRRDMDTLVNMGYARQSGMTKSTIYEYTRRGI